MLRWCDTRLSRQPLLAGIKHCNRLEQILTPILGPGRSLAKVNAELDFSQRTTRKEMYDPNATVVRSEQKSEESTSGTAAVDASGATTTPRGGGSSLRTSSICSTRRSREPGSRSVCQTW